MRIFLLTGLIFTLAACTPTTNGGGATAATETNATATQPAATQTAAAVQEKPMSEYTDKIVEIKTSLGTMAFRFFPEIAPNHVRNFIDLAESGFYNGSRFHRVIPGFVIQGGDPNTKTDNRGTWGMGGSGRHVKAEFNSKPHKPGVLSMARSQHPDSASSQFFIVVGDASFLDNNYTVFGEIVSGMDVANRIVAERSGEPPADPVRIDSATVRAATDAEKSK